MLLESVEVLRFRNLQGGMAYAAGLNILVGENGQGKTNWLEAISVLASTRSFRTGRLLDAIAFGGESAMVRGKLREAADGGRGVRGSISGRGKTGCINGKEGTIAR